jgi:lipopolysaccharide transport system permease protein
VLEYLKELWKYRGYVRVSVLRDIRSKYLNSALGMWWLLIGPAISLTIYTLVFSELIVGKFGYIKDKSDYVIYMASGILIWGLFAEIFNRSVNLFNDNAHLIKKINLPRLIFPVVILIVSFSNFIVIALLVLIATLVVKGGIGVLSIIYLVLPVTITMLLALSIGLVYGIANIFLKDITQISSIVLQGFFWLTPIVYPSEILPDQYRVFFELNPMFNVVEVVHGLLLGIEIELNLLIYPAIIVICMIFAAIAFTKITSKVWLDEL